MKKLRIFLSMALLLGIVMGCAKEEAPELLQVESERAGPQLKLAAGPVSFGDFGILELLSSEIIENQSVFTYQYTPGPSPASEILLGAKMCRDSEVLASVSVGELAIGKVAYFKKYKQYRNIEWLQITGIPTDVESQFTLTLEGVWNINEGTAMLKDGNTFDTELMHVPECRSWDLPRVLTKNLEPVEVDGQMKLIVHGEITYSGLPEYYAWGIMWSNVSTPDADNPFDPNTNLVLDFDITQPSIFTCTIDPFDPNLTYYVRAIAVNEFNAYGDYLPDGRALGIGPGNLLIYSNATSELEYGDPVTDDRDGIVNTYESVKIGDLFWFTENLKYLPYINPGWKKGSLPGIYVYGYTGDNVNAAREAASYDLYGVLYTWDASITACPHGWRLPTDGDWKNLEMALGMPQESVDSIGWRYEGKVAESLKTKDGWTWDNDIIAFVGTNSSGFSAIPGGYATANKGVPRFFFQGSSAKYWTASEESRDRAFSRSIWSYNQDVSRDSPPKGLGYSVRCVQDVGSDGTGQ